jgi:hypothetical protein
LCFLFPIKNKAVVEALEPRRFSNRDAPVIPVVQETARARVGKVGGNRLRDAAAVQRP